MRKVIANIVITKTEEGFHFSLPGLAEPVFEEDGSSVFSVIAGFFQSTNPYEGQVHCQLGPGKDEPIISVVPGRMERNSAFLRGEELTKLIKQPTLH